MTTTPTPTVGARIRVTRTHKSGDSLTFDVRVQSFDDAHGVPVVRYESGGVALTGADGWTVTWEEIEPAPVALPPIPEPGYYLDRSGGCWRFEADWPPIGFGDEISTPWETAHTYGPFTRLVPATDVVDAGIHEATVKAFEAHAIRIHHEIHTTSWDVCDLLGMQDCAAVREYLARAEGATGGGR